MADPEKVIGFLDFAGDWGYRSLAFVMGGALLVTLPAFRLILKRPRPVLADGFSLPTKSAVDARLLGGAALFGVGWGLSGFCPGPSVAALSTGATPVLAFVASMLAGTPVYAWIFGDPVIARAFSKVVSRGLGEQGLERRPKRSSPRFAARVPGSISSSGRGIWPGQSSVEAPNFGSLDREALRSDPAVLISVPGRFAGEGSPPAARVIGAALEKRRGKCHYVYSVGLCAFSPLEPSSLT